MLGVGRIPNQLDLDEEQNSAISLALGSIPSHLHMRQAMELSRQSME